MNLYAASILIPVGVIMYTAHGGLKASCCQRHTLPLLSRRGSLVGAVAKAHPRFWEGPRWLLWRACAQVRCRCRCRSALAAVPCMTAPPLPLQATFMSTYLHTIVVFVALCLFAFEIYAVKSNGLGSPTIVWDHLTDIATLGGAYKGVSERRGQQGGAFLPLSCLSSPSTLPACWSTGLRARPTLRFSRLGPFCLSCHHVPPLPPRSPWLTTRAAPT
jgi:hypothetical protein